MRPGPHLHLVDPHLGFHQVNFDRRFGCWPCQEVCPFNQRSAAQTGEPAFQPRAAVTGRRLKDLLVMSEEEFQQKYTRSPVKRAKWRGLMRNVAAGLSRSGDQSEIDALPSVIDHPEELVEQAR